MTNMVYTWECGSFVGLRTVEDEIELHAEVTPEAESQLNIRLKDGRSVIIRQETTRYYVC